MMERCHNYIEKLRQMMANGVPDSDSLRRFETEIRPGTQPNKALLPRLPAQAPNHPAQERASLQPNPQSRTSQKLEPVIPNQEMPLSYPAPVKATPKSVALKNTVKENPIFAALESGLPVKYKDNFHISRRLEVTDGPLKTKFFDGKESVRKQLGAAIKSCNKRTKSGIVIEYVMGGWSDREEDWKPTVVIFCADQPQKEAIENKLKNLPNILKDYEHIIETEDTQLASGTTIENPSYESILFPGGYYAVFGNCKVFPLSTLCGLRCVVQDGSALNLELQFTLGGVIVANGDAYGLTTAHKLIDILKSEQGSMNINSSSSDANEAGPSKPAVKHDDGWHHIGTTWVGEYGSWTTDGKTEEETYWDWALIKLDQEEIHPNYILTPYPDSDQAPNPIEGFVPTNSLSYGEVWVSVGPGASLLGILIAQTTLLSFGEKVFEAYSIRLSRPLDDGSSGSWVIRDGKLCGYIFSRVVGKPWAYMLPIEPAFARISTLLDAKIFTSVQASPDIPLLSPSSSGAETLPAVNSELKSPPPSPSEGKHRSNSISSAAHIKVNSATDENSIMDPQTSVPIVDIKGPAKTDISDTFALLTQRELELAREYVGRWRGERPRRVVESLDVQRSKRFDNLVLEKPEPPKIDSGKGKAPQSPRLVDLYTAGESSKPSKPGKQSRGFSGSGFEIIGLILAAVPHVVALAEHLPLWKLTSNSMPRELPVVLKTEEVIFQDIVYYLVSTFSPGGVSTSDSLQLLWQDTSFQENLIKQLGKTKLDLIFTTFASIETSLRHLQFEFEQLHGRSKSKSAMLRTLRMLGLDTESRKIEKELANLTSYNVRLTRILQYASLRVLQAPVNLATPKPFDFPEQPKTNRWEPLRTGVNTAADNPSHAERGLAFGLREKYAKAEKMHRETLDLNKKVLGREHPDTLISMDILGRTLSLQGKYAEAEILHREALHLGEKILGPEHPDTLTSMANLASIYWSQGRWKEAEELGVEVLEMRKMVLGLEHPDTLTSMANLASIYQSQGRWKEAEELEVETLEMRKMVLGLEHPDTLTSMANLASIYQSQGRWKEAEELEVETLEMRKMVLGLEHPDTLTSMANLASIYQSQGRWKELNDNNKADATVVFPSAGSGRLQQPRQNIAMGGDGIPAAENLASNNLEHRRSYSSYRGGSFRSNAISGQGQQQTMFPTPSLRRNSIRDPGSNSLHSSRNYIAIGASMPNYSYSPRNSTGNIQGPFTYQSPSQYRNEAGSIGEGRDHAAKDYFGSGNSPFSPTGREGFRSIGASGASRSRVWGTATGGQGYVNQYAGYGRDPQSRPGPNVETDLSPDEVPY
ncbi:hypothetical protein BP5796_13226 [Coleophoma crateriformis]|uniref:Kinesin light chain n=1 Tax=Coleophoma crateriformis TaxID=565419 RepID=A0A3D8Q363_9HELO|nr:hypothetical protein BP5796_13226 [Coleophoma crateriformis]